jgi:hypothetical protein
MKKLLMLFSLAFFISLTLVSAHVDDRTVALSDGWNLLGYSGFSSTPLNQLNFRDTSNNLLTYNQAILSGKLTSINLTGTADLGAYSNKPFKFNTGRAYWFYTTSLSNVTFNKAGGNNNTETFSLSELTFVNASGVIKNITDAVDSDWVGNGTSTIDTLFYFYNGSAPELNRWPNIKTAVCDEFGCEGGPDTFDPWKGYFIHGLKNNITLLINQSGTLRQIGVTLNEGWNGFSMQTINLHNKLIIKPKVTDTTNKLIIKLKSNQNKIINKFKI